MCKILIRRKYMVLFQYYNLLLHHARGSEQAEIIGEDPTADLSGDNPSAPLEEADYLVYSSNSTCRLEMLNDGVVIVRALSSHDGTGSPNDRFKFSSTRVFKPTDSTLTARFTEEGTGCTLAGTLTFSGTATYVELEELPDTYIETTKFD